MKVLCMVILPFLYSLGCMNSAMAQSSIDEKMLLEQIIEAKPSDDKNSETDIEDTPVQSEYSLYRQEQLLSARIYIIALIIAALVSLVVVLRFLTKNGTTDPLILINGSGLVLVIFATILVVVISKSEQQLTAAIGILGAIVGYLFGAGTRSSKESLKNSTTTTPEITSHKS